MKNKDRELVSMVVQYIMAALTGQMKEEGTMLPPIHGGSRMDFAAKHVWTTVAQIKRFGVSLASLLTKGMLGVGSTSDGDAKNWNRLPYGKSKADCAAIKTRSHLQKALALAKPAYDNTPVDENNLAKVPIQSVLGQALWRQLKNSFPTAKAATRQAGKTAKPTKKVVDGHARFTAMQAYYELMRRMMKKLGVHMPVQSRAAFKQPKKALEAACLAGGLALPAVAAQ